MFCRYHLRSNSGEFRDHLKSRDHLRSWDHLRCRTGGAHTEIALEIHMKETEGD